LATSQCGIQVNGNCNCNVKNNTSAGALISVVNIDLKINCDLLIQSFIKS